MVDKKKCVLCNKELMNYNKSGYCVNCYIKSPQSLKYQREAQKKYSLTASRKEWVKKYRSDPKTKEHIKEYQKKYQSEHKEKMREFKRKWAEKNRREK